MDRDRIYNVGKYRCGWYSYPYNSFRPDVAGCRLDGAAALDYAELATELGVDSDQRHVFDEHGSYYINTKS